MIQATSIENARRLGRRHIKSPGMVPQTKGVWRTNYMGYDSFFTADAPPDPSIAHPIAYLVEQEPDSVLRPHYHAVNQFQVFVHGGGQFGRHSLSGGFTLHFTGPYSPYGPISAGPEGIEYLTLRTAYDPGGLYLPESVKQLRATGRNNRQAFAGPLQYASPVELAGLKDVATSTLIAPEMDGLATWLHRIPPRQSINGPNPGAGGGQFWLVLGGGLEHGGEMLPRLSCVFVSSNEDAFVAKAGSHGLDVLILQFPN
jgi:hypothetical protein